MIGATIGAFHVESLSALLHSQHLKVEHNPTWPFYSPNNGFVPFPPSTASSNCRISGKDHIKGHVAL